MSRAVTENIYGFEINRVLSTQRNYKLNLYCASDLFAN